MTESPPGRIGPKVPVSIGPQLPPHLIKNETINIYPELPSTNKNMDQNSIGPQIPPHLLKNESLGPEASTGSSNDSSDLRSIGPQLPPHLRTNESTNIDPTVSSTNEVGPQLPPQLLKKETANFGPQLPPHLLNSKETNVDDSKRVLGPHLPPDLKKQLEEQATSGIEEDEDDDGYGPLPVGMSTLSAAQVALEERALQLQIDKMKPDNNEPTRESWMIELPETKAASFGLGPRQFRNRAAPDMSDRSSWTDIAGQKGSTSKEKKVDLKAEAERKDLKKRDEEFDKISKKLKRKNKSLVDLHQDKIKKKEEETGSVERKPFNRETDLQVNKFDEAQKKAVMKKAQLLDDRFSTGKSKYL